jgi:curved DNA-binding protein CbpA
MASNFYHILEASEVASPETLQGLFEQKRDRLEKELEDGSPIAKEQLWVLKQAYQTLSSPTKRAAYDESAKAKVAQSSNTSTLTAPSEGLSWKMNALLLALLASGLVGMGLHFGKSAKQDDHTAQVLLINRSSDNDATRAGTERILVNGVINNDSKVIDRSAELGSRSLNIQQDAENRQRQELEYRANTSAQMLEMQRQNQDRQLAMQEQRAQETRRQAEERKADNERRYWACMNGALDKMSGATASARCAGIR